MTFCSSNGFTLINSLFWTVKLTANPDSEIYSYFGYDNLLDIHLNLMVDLVTTSK